MNLLNKTVLILINSCHCCSHPTIACSGGSSQIPREQFPCPASLLKPRFALNYPYREDCWVHGCWASAFLWLLRKCFPPKKERVSGLQRMGSDHSLQWYFSNSQELSPLSCTDDGKSHTTLFLLSHTWLWGAELAVTFLGSILLVGLGLPQPKIGMTWIWPVFCLLGLCQQVQESYE